MPAVSFTLNLTGLEEKIAYLEAMRERMRDLRPVWNWFHLVYLAEVAQQFLTEGQYFEGQKWTALNPAYERYKLKHYGIPPSPLGILYRTGRLFSSLTTQDSPDHIFEATETGVIVGSAVEYGLHHQDGSERGLPMRPILSLRERMKRDLFRATMIYLMKGRTPPIGASGALVGDDA